MVFCPPETEHLEPTNFELPWKLVSTSIRERHEQEAAAKEQAQDDESKAKLKELKARKKAMQRMQSVQVCYKKLLLTDRVFKMFLYSKRRKVSRRRHREKVLKKRKKRRFILIKTSLVSYVKAEQLSHIKSSLISLLFLHDSM